MSEPRPLKYGEFECKGKGLIYASYARATPAQLLAALVESTPSAKNGISKTTTKHEEHSKEWWQAQVRLYGFKCPKWTIKGMKKVFMEKIVSTVKIDAELEGIESQLDRDYMRIDKKENTNSASSEKDEPEEDESEEDESEIDEPAEINTKAVEPQPRKYATQALRKGYRDASDESRLDKVNRLHNKYLSAGPPDDVIFGEWHFDCPEITEAWDKNCDETIVWKIHPPQNSENYMWAVIHQVVIEGIVEIEWDSAQDWKDKKHKFDFSGKETGAGYAQEGGEYGWITFTSSHECHATFHSDLSSESGWKLTGKKVSRALPTIPAKKCYDLYYQETSGRGRKAYWEWDLD